MVLPRFVEAAIQGRSIVVHDDGNQERCFAHVADVVDAVVTLTESTEAYGRVFNIGSDQTISILDLAKKVRDMVNPQVEIEFQSYSDAYDKDFEDIRRRVPDLSRIRKSMDYKPKHNLDSIIRDVHKEMLREKDFDALKS